VWKSVYRFHARQVDQMVAGRFLMAGDGAHLVAPFGARGLNSGVPDAENAAWKVAFAMKGWADPSLVETYHDERHAAAAENLEVTAATMRFLVPQSEAEWAQRSRDPRRRRRRPSRPRQGQLRAHGRAVLVRRFPAHHPVAVHVFPGPPPKGEDPVPAPGVIAPDLEVTYAVRRARPDPQPGPPRLARARRGRPFGG
jgi:3-(3-hydroxy-phenyl)propionate hydroxylase